MPSDYTARSWRSDSLSLYARDYSSPVEATKLPVVCLHGLTRNSKDFGKLAARLSASGHRVIVPDMRGRGLSAYDPDPMRYVPATYAHDVVALLHDLAIDRAIFVGTSMGGIITMEVAAGWPRLVAAAVLNDVGPEASPEGLARIASYAGKPVRVENWDDARDYVRQVNEAAFPLFGDDEWAAFAKLTFREDGVGQPRFDYDPAIAEPIKAGLLRTDPAVAWRLFERFCANRPVLLLRGLLSDIVSEEIAARMRAHARTLTVAGIANVGHAPLLDEPDALDALDPFLNRVAGVR